MPDTRSRIAVLGTGGTIAGRAAPGLSYRAGSLSVQELLQALPGVDAWADLHCEQIANVGSQTIGYLEWRALVQRVRALAHSGGYDGIVITHGTDTMEETAYLLHLTVAVDVPVVLTGAMRPAHVPGADGPANLRAALVAASSAEARGRGVLVVMNDEIHAAREVQKMSASSLSAFASPNAAPLGWVRGRGTVFREEPRGSVGGDFAGPLPDALPSVEILYSHADMDTRLVQAMLALNPAGLVLAGVGNGNTSDDVLAQLREAARNGVLVVRASRTGAGRVARNGEIDDDACGFVASGGLSPQKSRILLRLALAQGHGPQQVQSMFLPW